MSRPHFKRAVILGVGLLGGSLGLALRKKKLASQVIGWGREPQRLRKALKAGVIQEAHTDLGLAVAEADLIILCTPFDRFDSLLQDLALLAPKGCLVTDVGSVKGAVPRWQRLAKPLKFVGSHPMAGGEKTGFEHAKADLFQGAACFVTPCAGVDRAALGKVAALWKALGSWVLSLSPLAHDRQVAKVSHLPHAMAFALCAQLASEGSRSDFEVAGNGFWDSSRVGASDPRLWTAIFEANRPNMVRLIKGLEKQLAGLRQDLQKKNAKAVHARLRKAAAFRRSVDLLRDRP
jgi:prephenate dehydrogenase